MIFRSFLTTLLLSALALASCSKDDDTHPDTNTTIEILSTVNGVEFVRTPDEYFQNLPDWPYAYQYVEIDELRQAYVEAGPANGEVVLLLHGQPSWSYLYRNMIPVLADAGYRVIAMDHLGMGRSDKPVDISEYSYLGHADRLERFIQQLGLSDINLFVQDWGSLIGLRVAGLNPDWFATISVGNGSLPVIPQGFLPLDPIENPDEVADLPFPWGDIPAQQVPFYDGCELIEETGDDFALWANYSLKDPSFRASQVLEALTWFDLPSDVEEAYDAPFPSREYMAGVRIFPSLVNELGGINEQAWAGLTTFERPFLTIWGSNDNGSLGACETQQNLINNIPGAAGKPHTRLPEAGHFLQDDQGPEIATRLVEFYNTDWGSTTDQCTNFDSSIENEERTQFLMPPSDLRGFRYGEVLPSFKCGSGLVTEVYVTMGFNDCPEDEWYLLNADDLTAQLGAEGVTLNGPRHWLMTQIIGGGDNGSSGFEKIATFGSLQMQLAAQIDGAGDDELYSENEVQRSTTFIFKAGNEVYKLVNPDGDEYIMQSYSRKVNPDLAITDLATLGSSLNLPEGWIYKTEVLATDLEVVANGLALVIQDELENSYQKIAN